MVKFVVNTMGWYNYAAYYGQEIIDGYKLFDVLETLELTFRLNSAEPS
jgi:hypothetical protein